MPLCHKSLSEVLAAHDVFTSRWANVDLVILRNIPKEFTVAKVLQLLLRNDDNADSIEFVYAPCAAYSQTIRGFAFVKFTSMSSAMRCREYFHHKILKKHFENGPLVVEPGSWTPLDTKGTMFCDHADAAMQPVYMNDPEVKEIVDKYRSRRLRRKRTEDDSSD
eukprot:TRINITY_DN7918_c0_g1_i1.p1 TRINITY_DN7918_c0_g1~~TRINITY_DN7918_c0_g1_i1.p1  ORF type:complete len:164 (-),score=32.79 TRINITY_DN7918_c0_g1_i1:410-901(-)